EEAASQARAAIEGNRVAAAPTTAPAGPPAVSASALAAANGRCAATVDRFEEVDRNLPRAGRPHLFALLARHGGAILPDRLRHSDQATTDDLAAVVKRHDPLGNGVRYVLPTGTLDVFPNAAVFAPADGGESVRAVAGGDDGDGSAAPPDPAAHAFLSPADRGDDPSAPQPSGLTRGQVDLIVQQADRVAGNKLNPAQRAALGAELRAGNERLISSASVATAVTSARVKPDGVAEVVLADGTVDLSPAGRLTVTCRFGLVPDQLYPSGLTGRQIDDVVRQADRATNGKLTQPQEATLAAELQSGTAKLVPPGRAYAAVRRHVVQLDGSVTLMFHGGVIEIDPNGNIGDRQGTSLQEVTIHPLGLTLLIGEEVASALLGLFLIFAGVTVLRSARRGIGMLRLYAWAKLLVVAVGAAAFLWVAGDMASGFGKLFRTGRDRGGMTAFFTACIIGGAIFPAVLMCLLYLPSVRAYERNEAE
ncbi:MAG TPA: hypothetical protein VF796_03700, partial [Humisphaera sp.]